MDYADITQDEFNDAVRMCARRIGVDAILDIPGVAEILKACGADIERLRRELEEFIDQSTPRLKGESDQDVQPTLGFQRVLQRAVFHVQSSGKKEVKGENVIVAIFGEK